MGRWDYGLYDSDGTLDYHATITMRLERELAYWLSPENIFNDNSWLAQILTVIELMLIFENHDERSAVYLQSEKQVQRWQDLVLSVWDSDWNNEKGFYPYSDFTYRQTHRLAIVRMFDRLKSIAVSYHNIVENGIYSERVPLLAEYPLPYFSVKKWVNSNNVTVVSAERLVDNLFVQLQKDVEYCLSSDRRIRVVKWEMPHSNEDVLAAVDSLTLLSEAYERSPSVNLQTIQRWRSVTIELDKEFSADTDPSSGDQYLKLINETFDKLDAVAQKYQYEEWY